MCVVYAPSCVELYWSVAVFILFKGHCSIVIMMIMMFLAVTMLWQQNDHQHENKNDVTIFGSDDAMLLIGSLLL